MTKVWIATVAAAAMIVSACEGDADDGRRRGALGDVSDLVATIVRAPNGLHTVLWSEGLLQYRAFRYLRGAAEGGAAICRGMK